jgi:hypothetical protein
VRRERAVLLVEYILRNLDQSQGQWPLSLVEQLYVFGSFARGALEPHDVDMDIEHSRDERWASHFVSCMSYGRDPYSIIRRELTGGKRGGQFQFSFRDRADFEMTLLWQRGDDLATAMARLEAIHPDESAGRAPRDAMLPEFDGIDDWIPRPAREVLCKAVEEGAIRLERIALDGDAQIASKAVTDHLRYRWKPTSPLYRAAAGVVTYWEQQGIDPGRCHLHGADIRDRETPYFAGFGLRHFRAIPSCLTEYNGAEWIEVVHPTRTKPLHALRIKPLNRKLLGVMSWS